MQVSIKIQTIGGRTNYISGKINNEKGTIFPDSNTIDLNIYKDAGIISGDLADFS